MSGGGINIGSGFNYSAPRFLDSRQAQAKTRGDLLDWRIPIPEGFQVWLDSDKCWYIYDTSDYNSQTGYFRRSDIPSTPTFSYRDRGIWSYATACSDQPYEVREDSVDIVWYFGCKYKCLLDRTLSTPEFGSPGWLMVEGNPIFSVDIDSTGGWVFDYDRIRSGRVFTTLCMTGDMYNQDVTRKILPDDVVWTRDTGNKDEDDAWAIKRAEDSFRLDLSSDDLGPDYLSRTSCNFIVTVQLREGNSDNTPLPRVFQIARGEVSF